MTLYEFLPTHVEGRNLSQQYVQQVGCTVQAFGQWHGKPVTLDEMSVELVDEWIRSMLHRRKPTPIKQSTATWHREALMAIWRRAHELGATKNEPPSTKYTMPPGTTEYSRQAVTLRAATAQTSVTGYVRDYQIKSGCNDDSAEQYRIAGQCLERFCGRRVTLAEIEPTLVNHWLADLARHLKPESVRSRRNHLVALWRSAHADGLCPTPYVPARIRKVRLPYRANKAWTIDQVRLLVDVARSLEGDLPNDGVSIRFFWEFALRAEWDSALRLGDLFGAKVADFNDRGEAVITQHKTGRPTYVRLNSKTVAMCEASRWRDRERLLPWPHTYEHFRKEFAKLVVRAGLDGSFRKLRRSSATHVEIRNPGTGAVHLGHLTGFKTADTHYFDFGMIAAAKPQVEEL